MKVCSDLRSPETMAWAYPVQVVVRTLAVTACVTRSPGGPICVEGAGTEGDGTAEEEAGAALVVGVAPVCAVPVCVAPGTPAVVGGVDAGEVGEGAPVCVGVVGAAVVLVVVVPLMA